MVYDLPVAEEKVQPHQITTLHLVCAIAFMVAGAIIFKYNFEITIWGLALLVAGLLLIIATIAKNSWLTSKRINPVIRIAELVLSAWIAVYSLIQQWKFPTGIFGVLSAAVLFALYWERAAGAGLFIQVHDEGVKLPVTSRRRFIPWTEIEQVVFRFGTLTIDCVDNKLFQWNITNVPADTAEFEAFCLNKVNEHRDKRRKNDW